jgi:pimeloyl-ACP methyl ester carboxylesterase
MTVEHAEMDVGGVRVFFREAGRRGAPALLLPHGYPCSSYQYRNLMSALSDRWHVLAPDFPGFGYSATPDPARFDYSFDGYAEFLEQFARARGLERFVLYLHDYGSQIGLRLALRAPERITGLIVQNGDIYADVFGPKYGALLKYFEHPTSDGRRELERAVSEEGFRDEFLNDVREELQRRLSPDLWTLAWLQLNHPVRREIMVRLMEGLKQNLEWFPRYQAYLREHRPPTLIVWGPQDGYMPEAAARAYLRDLPDAELHVLDGGHWALETNLEEIVVRVRDFLLRTQTGRG